MPKALNNGSKSLHQHLTRVISFRISSSTPQVLAGRSSCSPLKPKALKALNLPKMLPPLLTLQDPVFSPYWLARSGPELVAKLVAWIHMGYASGAPVEA